MSAQPPAKTPWEFRLRAFFIAIAFGLGFFFGYPIQAALFHDVDPTFVMIGERLGGSGVYLCAWIAAGLAIAAWLIRFWGSSYHASGVVMSGDVVTNTLTVAGPYRYVRNPLYLGNILLAIAIGSLGPPVATVLVIALNVWFVYRLIGIEERFLRGAMGEAYERYCAAVPRLLPRLTPAPLGEDQRKPNIGYGFLTELFSLGFAAAMVYFAISIPYGGGRDIGYAFWSIAFGAIAMQMILSPVARRAGGDAS
jgi:protein-S-isoprenylcysteine O-methyltransferase Ste14